MIKDMERAVFKRETIQLKYLPKVEKKNAQDKTSQGKLSRQIANLKQTLKHTTESSIQLDSTIEQKINELKQVNDEIEKANKELQETEEDIYKQQSEGKRYDEISGDGFRPSVGEDKVQQALEDQYNLNKMIENILIGVINENQELEPVLGRLINWDGEQA